jgi:hypothetical protein
LGKDQGQNVVIQLFLKYDQPLYNEVIRDYNYFEEANQLPNQRSKKLAVVDSTPFILVGMVAYANI